MNRILIICLLILFKTEAQTLVLNMADSLYVNGNYSKAIAQYKKYNNQPEVYSKVAKAYIGIGNYDLALQHYKLSVEAYPNDALTKFEYARLLSQNKKFDLASKAFNDLILIDNKNPNYYYELGLVLEQLRDSTAQNSFHKAFELDETHQKNIYKIAKFYLQKRKYVLANKYINKGLESYENNIKLISLKAQNYYWQQDYRAATVWFEKLITLGETSEFIYEKLSLCYEAHFNYKKALEYRLKALRFNPNDAIAQYIIGTYYYELKNFEQAEKYISKALLVLDKSLDTEYMKLGTVLNRQKKYKASIVALKKAINEAPLNQFAHFQLALTLEAYYVNYDAKLKVYEDLKKKFPNGGIIRFVDAKISKLKEEKFINEGKKED